MEESILISIKEALGVESTDSSFDNELLLHINSVFSVMEHIGMMAFNVQDTTATWSDFFGERADLNFIKTYIVLKVRLLFDPPQNSFLVASIEKHCQELEWRINTLEVITTI